MWMFPTRWIFFWTLPMLLKQRLQLGNPLSILSTKHKLFNILWNFVNKFLITIGHQTCIDHQNHFPLTNAILPPSCVYPPFFAPRCSLDGGGNFYDQNINQAASNIPFSNNSAEETYTMQQLRHSKVKDGRREGELRKEGTRYCCKATLFQNTLKRRNCFGER